MITNGILIAPLSQLLFEDYTQTAKQVDHSFRLLLEYFDKETTIEEGLLQRIIFAVRGSLNNPFPSSSSLQELITSVIRILSGFDVHRRAKKIEKEVISLFVEFQALDHALEETGDFILKRNVSEPSDFCIELSRFACRYFDLMHDERRWVLLMWLQKSEIWCGY